MSNMIKFLMLMIILYMINIISPNPKNNISFTDKSIFPNKSIYFSSLKEGFSSNPNKFISQLEKPHRTDTMIIKIEKNIIEDESDSKNFLSLQISKSYFNIMACVETEKISKKLKNFLSRFIEISDEKNQCYYTQDYFEFDFNNINSKNQKEKFTSTRNLNYPNINILNENKNFQTGNSEIQIDNFLDINLFEYKEAIENFTSDFLMWNENCYFELAFKLDSTKKNIFHLQKIFIYFSYPDNIEHKSYYISLIKNGKETFDNIFIFHRNSNKIVKFSQKFEDNLKPINEIIVDDFNDDLLNYTPYITTQRDESIYHNHIMINFEEKLLTNYVNKFKLITSRSSMMSYNNDICFHIFQPLTADMYLEKNEFKAFLKNRHTSINSVDMVHKINFDLMYTLFIDQELSSDLAEKGYISFILCDNLENLKKINYQISYPIHFRYQPALGKSDKKFHQSVVMPQPFIQILQKNSTHFMPEIGTTLFGEFLYAGNIFDKTEYYFGVKKSKSKENSVKGFEIEFDQKRLFLEEVEKKLKFNIHYYNTFLFNKDRLVHQVPAGKENHFIIVFSVTVIVTILGVLFILYALLIYVLRDRKSNLDFKEKNK